MAHVKIGSYGSASRPQALQIFEVGVDSVNGLAV